MSKFHLTKCRCCKLGYICDEKFVLKLYLRKFLSSPTGIEPMSPDCRYGCFTTRLYIYIYIYIYIYMYMYYMYCMYCMYVFMYVYNDLC